MLIGLVVESVSSLVPRKGAFFVLLCLLLIYIVLQFLNHAISFVGREQRRPMSRLGGRRTRKLLVVKPWEL
jgi:hypothetical protein